MAGTKFRALVNLERNGALPEDSIVNVFHFEGDISIGSNYRDEWDNDVNDLAARIDDFYDAISGLLTSTLTGNGVIKVYDMTDATPREPRHIRNIVFNAAGAPLPAEVAIAVTLQCDNSPGVPRARRRGRVFIGPLDQSVGEAFADSHDLKVSAATRNLLGTSMAAMAHGPDPGDARLAVFSPTTLAQGGTLDDAFNDVTSIKVDDAFDVQRRRGASASVRSSYLIP